MSDLPILELTFQNVVGSPWEGEATLRLAGNQYGPFAVREGMTGRQRDDVRWYVEQYMDYPEGGHEKRARQIEQQLHQYGLALWHGLQQAPQLAQWLGAVQMAGGGRLELRANTPADEVAFRSPWELMRVGGGNGTPGTLLHQLGVNVVRRVQSSLPALAAPDTTGGLRVLAVVCRPDEAGFLDPRYTPEAILDALADRPEVSVDFCRPGTLAALIAALERAREDERPYHVVHFDGHGTTLPDEAGIGALCFEQEDGRMDLVRADQFGDLMSGYHIPLVVLEACRTAQKTFARETVAGALLRHGVGTVVAMGYAVHVDMTRELMSSFYAALARGRTLGQSLGTARKHVHAVKHRRMRVVADAPQIELQDWFAPQLYQGGEDRSLLPKRVSRRKRPADPLFAGFPPPPQSGFHGRGYELHKLERLLARERAVVVHAPGGMGKTALSREAAHWWLRTGMFPGGAVFVSLEGNPSPDRVVVQVGEALEGIDFYKRDTADRRAFLKDELAQRPMLIVWDNFESVLPHFQHRGLSTPAEPDQTDSAAGQAAGAAVTVFLSHSSQDKPLARKIAADLRDHGLEVWFDEAEIRVGDSIAGKIQQGLNGADFVAVLLTAASVASGWVDREWQSLIDREIKTGKTVILPLKADDCQLPPLLAGKLFADFTGDYDAALAKVVKAVGVPASAGSPPQSTTQQPTTTPQPPEGGTPTGVFAELAAEWTAGRTRLLVTCRDAQPRLDSGSLTVRPFALGELSETEGLMLLVGRLDRLGFDRSERERRGWTAEALQPIVNKTLGHPLSLELLAPHVVRLGAEAVAAGLPDILSAAEQDHDEARNRSIRESLEFSIRHLTPAARAALPAVALLSGGCLEAMAVDIVGLDPSAWDAVRAELERTGLVRTENGFLRPHPVLDSRLSLRESSDHEHHQPPRASGQLSGNQSTPAEPADSTPLLMADAETIDRFPDVVKAFCGAFDQLVRTPQARAALAAMAGSEVVVRRAIDRAAAAGRMDHVMRMANGLRLFLQRSGRGGEGAALMTGLQAAVAAAISPSEAQGSRPGSPSHELTKATAQLAIHTAWAAARQDAAGSAAALGRLLDELAAVTAWDTRFERATALVTLGRIRQDFHHRPAEAIAPLEQAATLFAELEGISENTELAGDGSGDQPNPDEPSPGSSGFNEASPPARIASTNRAATLGDLANALLDLGRFDEALDAAQLALALDQDRNDHSAAACGLGQIAQILQKQGRYDQAETRYHEALKAATDAGDDETIGITWQSLGVMNLNRNRLDEAARAMRQALDACAHAGNDQGQMQVLNALGNVEQRRGNAEAALAWYERSLQMAAALGDVQGQAMARGNRAILLSAQAEAAEDPGTRQRLLNQAISEERESLALKEQMGHPASIAISHNNLANYLRLAGQLDEAEQHARTALAIFKQLNDPRVPSTLQILEKIAEARGDSSAAAEYRAAKEAAHDEARQRAGDAGLPAEVITKLLQLALTARTRQMPLADALRSAGADDDFLATMQERDPWLAAHLEALAAGHSRPAVPVPAPHQPVIDAVWTAAGT